MRKIAPVIMSSLLGFYATAQPDYPTAPQPPGKIIKAEYFFDADPGMGNGTAIPLAPVFNASNLNFTLPLNGLRNGGHKLYIRTMDENGRWAHIANGAFDNFITIPYPVAPPTAVNISEIEYFIDTDPGPGNGHKLPVASTLDTGPLDFVINISGLAAQVHRLYVRSKNVEGKWSLINYSIFDNNGGPPYPTAPTPAPPIGQLEYFVDTDPGIGNGTAVSLTPTGDLSDFNFTIPTTGLAQGPHTIYFRSRQNPWSFTAYAELTIGGVILPVTWLYFSGELKNQHALLSWAVATESNTKDFVIEYSSNGRDFYAVGTLQAAGNGTGTTTYRYDHTRPVRGINYYRIKQTDMDNEFTYSRIVSLLNTDQQKETFVGPNPVKDQLYIVEPALVHIDKVDMLDINGRTVLQKSFKGQNSNLFKLDVSKLPAGAYVLHIAYPDTRKTFKVIKE